MAIPTDSLSQKFVVVDLNTTVGEVRACVAATKNNWTYVVTRLNNNEWAVFRLTDLIKLLKEITTDLAPVLNLCLANILSAPCRFATSAVEQATASRSDAQRLLRENPSKRFVVVSEGKVVGVLANESRTMERANFDWLDQAAIASPAGEALGGCADANDVKRPVQLPYPSPGTLSGTDPVVPTATQPPEARWINVEILDHAPTAPLQLGQTYTLAFDVDTEVRSSSLLNNAALSYRFSESEEVVQLTVQLSSSDFEIYTEPQILRVPRSGKSKGRARFDIEPKHKGEGVINAVFLKDGNFIQLLTLRLNTGELQTLTSESMSRPIDSAFDVKPRDLGLVITNTGTGFKLILTGPVYAEANLPLTLPQLDQMIGQARAAIKEVVNLAAGANKTRVYQQAIDIAPEIHQLALKHLAETGFLLFQQMFYSDAADAQSKLLGDKLVEMSERQTLNVQIVSQQFQLPWGLLYMARDFDPNAIDAERFLGFKHIIEHIPLQPSMQVVDSVIRSQPNLIVSLNVNSEIDRQMGAPLIGEQLNYWNRISKQGRAKVIIRQTGAEVQQALAESLIDEQMLYFYCHATSAGLNEAGGPDASCLQLGGPALTLRDLKLRSPAKKSLSGAPLVFINACESAELSPLFYGGFVPYFMTKGARGVIGTECETPALFAREWARRFFDKFLAGEPLGKAFLDLRREFLFKHNNVMGLLYAIYCDGDTQVVPSVDLSD